MKYREMIKKIQHDSGFSDIESKEALDLTTKTIAERLTDDERKDFASQLPQELQEIALSADTTSELRKMNILEEFMERAGIEEPRAKKQILTSWKAIKSSISPGNIKDIRSQLKKRTAEFLH